MVKIQILQKSTRKKEAPSTQLQSDPNLLLRRPNTQWSHFSSSDGHNFHFSNKHPSMSLLLGK